MPRTPAPGTRDTILRAASGLFYRHGVRAVGMAQVIEAAGCGKNLLYRHFPSKADLAAAYLSLVRGERDRSITRALDTAADPGERLVALVTEVAELVRDPRYRGCAFRNYLTEFPGDDDEPARIARAYLADTRAQVDDLVAALGRPGTLADRIWLIIGGLHGGAPEQGPVAVAWVSELVTA
ncbi:TetR family transcriptional regulator [Actinoplanes ianthinogenes]|uniref:TetR family transcriptional regulator n=1 Tax=Actinoplanes ianthinogenes TaxID=122358 RepID=A0ABN6CSE9_9ACTN|nr:TetR/AcrR family transcriptional regulator [Actinoplanes ianthinogenes]BCJ48052.1 TetR family transcriptional regulator [Actinoplanes ianthinogenes]GGR06062.1 TetR family transcriptional regulator [Actinoplanes ianthinogenes]